MTGKKSLLVKIIQLRTSGQALKAVQDAPEEIKEPNGLYNHSNQRPLQEDQQDTTEKTYRAADFLLPREEVERLMWTDDKGYAREKQDLQSSSVSSCYS